MVTLNIIWYWSGETRTREAKRGTDMSTRQQGQPSGWGCGGVSCCMCNPSPVLIFILTGGHAYRFQKGGGAEKHCLPLAHAPAGV